MRPHEQTRLPWAADATAAALCLFLLLRGRAVMDPDRLVGLAAVTAFP